MKHILIKIFFIFTLVSCVDKTSKNTYQTPLQDSSATSFSDGLNSNQNTTIYPFKDSAYKLVIHVFDTTINNEEENNCTISFLKFQQSEVNVLFQDSVFCNQILTEHQNFNNDNNKDILIFHSTGARANPTYHLYLVDPLIQKLTRVREFENIPNPNFDSVNNIITSSALYGGRVATSFHTINSRAELIPLGHSIDTEFDDSIEYEKAIKKILKERAN